MQTALWAIVASAAFLFVDAYMAPDGGAPPQVPPRQARALREPTRHATWVRARADAVNALSGRVETPDGSPIAAARVCATCTACELITTPIQTCVEADEGGRFAFDNIPPTAYMVTATARGFAAGSAREGEPIKVAAGGAVDGITVVLEHDGQEVSGMVVDALGGPVPAATVRVVRLAAPPLAVSVVSDADGRFGVWVPPGGVTVTAAADGYTMAKTYRVAPTRDVELVLTPSGTIRGRVESAEPRDPVADAEVRARIVGGPPVPNELTTISQADGSFEVVGLGPGNYVLEAVGAHYRGGAATPVAVALGDTVEGVVVAVHATARLAGRVLVGSSQTPCERGTVVLGPPLPGTFHGAAEGSQNARPPISVLAAIAADGSVEFDGVLPGTYFASVDCFAHTLHEGPRRIAVEREDIVDLQWRVEPGIGLSVRVVDEAGLAVPGATVFLMSPPTRPGGPTPATPLTTDRDGHVSVPRYLLPGRYSLQSPEQSGSAVTVDLAEGDAVRDVVLTLRGSAGILVRVQGPKAAPIDSVLVLAEPLTDGEDGEDESAGDARAAAALGDGRFQFNALEPGAYRVSVADGTNPPLDAGAPGTAVIARPGRVTETTIVLERTSAISGRVVDTHGGPIADAWVSADAASGTVSEIVPPFSPGRPGPRRVLTDAHGEFRIDRLVSGVRYDLSAKAPVEGLAADGQADAGDAVELVLQAGSPSSPASAQPTQPKLERLGFSQ